MRESHWSDGGLRKHHPDCTSVLMAHRSARSDRTLRCLYTTSQSKAGLLPNHIRSQAKLDHLWKQIQAHQDTQSVHPG
ncbi:hypothetical protein X975_20596, partial [Stegodyphus mimosarum]